MADQYIPGLQFQNWAAMPSLTQSILSGGFSQTPLGLISAALLGSTYGKEKQPIAGAVIPEDNKQNWQNIPSSQIQSPVPPPGLNPNMIGNSPIGLGPVGMRVPQLNTIQPITGMDMNRVKQGLWE